MVLFEPPMIVLLTMFVTLFVTWFTTAGASPSRFASDAAAFRPMAAACVLEAPPRAACWAAAAPRAVAAAASVFVEAAVDPVGVHRTVPTETGPLPVIPTRMSPFGPAATRAMVFPLRLTS
ncbi:hypothetical protein ADK94_07490 [Streptomyces sp. XY593]|nr:hypothetical protein ADK94_07490 [Streptomyces sp. XY593]KOV03694.1 hypothetical protein ADK92_08610 [Streptomyces sp. XY533]KOV14557.1 hypothetical protein ADK91_07605 [Streptomyces sp. XY511]KOV25747.1 hypothetical protein ADK90_05715 [Streptomyces sp. XY413]